mmetsp:Transcript_37179/g.51598  ORF Transcript_37179/g.51598 Transcript_37179/m.51598 type:complete len:385 (+) Transcript_37179:303-1457(+)|eukprot:CAMPEP_0196575784 /NCGR_PEP_ID=MMETSP1081-20130531/5191_1 /TAXON_ID=36882 /ORGANISM="Pyramimonas amylifera, Strain CCMP720" /LENGTH=384 /DNA_ID=CAMNT_0041894191 /DNA_START=229 /DNA_END=1383 /DNA_ORIENTATION=+
MDLSQDNSLPDIGEKIHKNAERRNGKATTSKPTSEDGKRILNDENRLDSIASADENVTAVTGRCYALEEPEAPRRSHVQKRDDEGTAKGDRRETKGDVVRIGSHYEDAIYQTMNPRVLKLLKYRFKELDSDHNNILDFAEFRQAFALDDGAISKQMFNLYDTDNSGTIDVDEFIQELSNRVKPGKDAARRIFELADLDRNGFIEKNELVEILTAANAYKKNKPTPEQLEDLAEQMMRDVCKKAKPKNASSQRISNLVCFCMGKREQRKVAHEVEQPLQLTEKRFIKLCKKYEEIIFPLNRVLEKETQMARLFGFDMFQPLFRGSVSWKQEPKFNEHRAGIGVPIDNSDILKDADISSVPVVPLTAVMPTAPVATKNKRRRSVMR